jgi:hypothetical protein
MAKPILSAERLRELLYYDPAAGIFTWRVSRAWHTKPGDVAATLNDQGYALIKIDQRLYRAHRLAWLYVTGDWPKDEIDHINGVRLDNRIENLRDVRGQVNRQNHRSACSDSASGVYGVSKDKRRNGWYAQISVNNKNRRIGSYPTREEAHAAYLAAKRRLHEGCTI